MVKYAAIAVTDKQTGEKSVILQRVHIMELPPKGVCGSRINVGNARKPKSATCWLKPGHLYNPDHCYRADCKPNMLVAKKAVMAKHKGAKWLGWFDNFQPLQNSGDVELRFDGRKYVKG